MLLVSNGNYLVSLAVRHSCSLLHLQGAHVPRRSCASLRLRDVFSPHLRGARRVLRRTRHVLGHINRRALGCTRRTLGCTRRVLGHINHRAINGRTRQSPRLWDTSSPRHRGAPVHRRAFGALLFSQRLRGVLVHRRSFGALAALLSAHRHVFRTHHRHIFGVLRARPLIAGQSEPDNQCRTIKSGQSEPDHSDLDNQSRAIRAGQSEPDHQIWSISAGQSEPDHSDLDNQSRVIRAGQSEPDHQSRTIRCLNIHHQTQVFKCSPSGSPSSLRCLKVHPRLFDHKLPPDCYLKFHCRLPPLPSTDSNYTVFLI